MLPLKTHGSNSITTWCNSTQEDTTQLRAKPFWSAPYSSHCCGLLWWPLPTCDTCWNPGNIGMNSSTLDWFFTSQSPSWHNFWHSMAVTVILFSSLGSQTFPEVQCQHLAISPAVISLSHKEHLALTGHKVASKYKWVDWWVENKRVLYVISWGKWQECLITVNIIYLLHFLFQCAIFYFHLRSTCMQLYYAASTPFLYTKYKLWINKQNARQASSLKDSLDYNFRAPGHSTFWKRYKCSFPQANLQLVNSLWLSKQVRVSRTDSPSVWGWEDPGPAPVGVYYVSSGSQLALHAGAKPQFQIRDATETC